MSSERMKILDMVSQGKLTVDEASQLLNIMAGSEAEVTDTRGENDPLSETQADSPEVGAPRSGGSSPERGVEPAASSEHPDDGEAPPERRIWDWIKRLVSSFGPREKYTEELDWEFDGGGIRAITAQTGNGSLKFAGSEENRVSIQARKTVQGPTVSAAKEFAQQVQIHIEQRDGALHIYHEHPKPPSEIKVSVSYHIQGPGRLDLTCETTNGEIEAEGAEGAIKTTTTNGKIQLRAVSGDIHARTTNGGISAQVARLKSDCDFATTNGSIAVDVHHGVAPISASTANGSIHFTLPTDFSGHLDAKTTNGRVQSDLATQPTKQSRNRLLGQIGAGGDTPLKLRTVNGSIRLAGFGF